MFCSCEFCVLLVERVPVLQVEDSRVHGLAFDVLEVGALPVVPDISEHAVVPVRDGAQCLVVALEVLVEGLQLVTFGLNLFELHPLLGEQGLVAGDGGSVLGILSLELGKVLLLPLLLLCPPS